MTIPSRSYLLKNIIESGVDIDESSYDDLCRYMLDSDGIIQAIELAPDGVVEQVYPLANNEQAVGLDLIHDEERGKNTTLAKNSGRQAIDLFAHQKVSFGARSTQSEQAYLLSKVLTF